MSSILTGIFKATIGLLISKGRDKAAEKLKEGDVTDQKFRSLIVREMDDIKSKLDGISRKDLLASASFFEEGIEILYDVFRDKAMSYSTQTDVPPQAGASSTSEEMALALTQRNRELDLIDLDESAKEMLANAKDRFEDARKKATEAFNNESLKLPDRILAMKYRVMATILETIDNYAYAFPACKVCIKELHALSKVRKNFKVEVEHRFMSRFGKGDRVEVISSVCHINRVVYDVFRSRSIFDSWPYIDTGKEEIEPLREEFIVRKVGLGHFYSTILRPGVNYYNSGLGECHIIVTNTNGDFIVATRERCDGKISLFNERGEFLYDLDSCDYIGPAMSYDYEFTSKIQSLASDRADNIHVLVLKELDSGNRQIEEGEEDASFHVLVFDKRGRHKKTVCLGGDKENGAYRHLAINDKEDMFICSETHIYVYGRDDKLRRLSADQKEFNLITGIVAIGDNVLVTVHNEKMKKPFGFVASRAHIFAAQGEHLKQIELMPFRPFHSLAFHRESRHFLITCCDYNQIYCSDLYVSIYTENGEFVHNIYYYLSYLKDMTVTPGGNIALLFLDGEVTVW